MTTMAPEVTIKCNNARRAMLSYAELDKSVQKDFDYMEDRNDDWFQPRFVLYMGSWYDTSDTDGLAPDWLKSHGFDTFVSESFFSGVAFKFFDEDGDLLGDGSEVIVGRYYM